MATMIQNNFVGGEISPALHSRSDLKAYYCSAAAIENFVVSKEGSLKKRRGIETKANINYAYSNAKLFPYLYDRDESGVLLLYYNSEGQTLIAQLRAKPGFAYVSGATVYSGSMTASQIKQIRAEQIGDTFYVTCKGLFNKKIVVTWSTKALAVSDYTQATTPAAVTSISAKAYDPQGNETTRSGRTYTYGAYVCRAGVLSPVKTCTCGMDTSWPAGYSIRITITHGQNLTTKDFEYIVVGKKSGSFFGELTRWYPEDVTASTVVFSDENHTAGDVIYSQTNVTGKNFKPPLIVNAFQQRLLFANANSDGSDLPMTLWFSEIGNLYNFYADRPSSDADPFSPTIMSTGPSFIRWLVPYQKAMIAFTEAGIFAIAGSQNEGFSSSTCQITKLSNAAVSQNIRPIETDDGIVFVGADDKTLYTMAYDLQTDSTRPISRMFLSKHLTRKSKITSIALQKFPDQVVWCSLSDGTALSFTFEEKQEVYAWARHKVSGAKILEVIGLGSVTDSSTDYTFGDIAFAIQEGSVMTGFYLGGFRSDYKDIVNGTQTNVVATVTTLAAESQQSTIKFARKNIKDVMISFLESGPVTVVPTDSNLAAQTVNTGATSFTGEAKVMPRGFISDKGQMTFISNSTTACEILGLVYKMEVND